MFTHVSQTSRRRFSRNLGITLTFSLLVLPVITTISIAAEKEATVSEPPAKLIVDPPQPDRLAGGVAIIKYRTENLQILPVFGAAALAVAPRIGHLHVTLDEGPLRWAHTSGEPLIISGLTPGSHKVLIEAVNANHEPLAQSVVKFEVPQPSLAQPQAKERGYSSAVKSLEQVPAAHENHGSAAAVPAAEQPPAQIVVDPPLPGPLAKGVVFINYRTENAQIAPVFGPAALAISPRVGHLHVRVDEAPWRWADASGGPVIVNGLPPRGAQNRDRAGGCQPPAARDGSRELRSAAKVTGQKSCDSRNATGGISMTIPIRPPFTRETALAKVRAAEDAWNSRDPVRVSLAYSTDSIWRNRDQFFSGCRQIQEFLAAKWQRELDYRLTKALWAFDERRIAVRFQYEWHNDSGQWFRSYGNELWEFDDDGLMRRREASINDVAIVESDRKFFWPAPGPRPADHPGIPDVK